MTVTFNEEMRPVGKHAKALNVHVSTIYRWGTGKGVRGHKLKLFRIGGRTFVQKSDWLAFVDALNHGSIVAAEVARERMPISVIDAELDAAGL